jgi:hypothetical protein
MKNLQNVNLMEFPVLSWIIFFLLSCNSDNTESVSLDFEQKNYEKEACVKQECASLSLSYPYFKGETEVVSLLNVHIEQQLVMFLNIGEDQEIVPLDSAVSTFLDSYISFKKEFDSPQEWEINVESKVTHLDEKLISIVFDSFSYTGGAHPNSFRMYLNFDPERKSVLKNEELVVDKNALLSLAEAKFKSHHNVSDNVSLAETGSFFLEDDKDFFLPAAMGFEGDEFVLFYNPYEIGPYVMGATELRFKKEEITGLVKNY